MAQQKPQQSSAKPQSDQMQQQGGMPQQQSDKGQSQGDQSQVQGEGNYTAAKEYDDAQRSFVESGRVEQAARDAAPKTQQEADEMKQAEREGRSHAKEEDPLLHAKSKPDAEGKPRDSQDH